MLITLASSQATPPTPSPLSLPESLVLSTFARQACPTLEGSKAAE